MKKMFKIKSFIALVAILLIASCSSDDDANIASVNLQDLAVTIDENPTDGQVIGTIQSNSTNPLTFSIVSQSPNGALNINANTGELTVADPMLFDFETNPTITAIISADGAQNTATVTITVNDVDEIVAQGTNITIDENPSNGDVIGSLLVTSGSNLTYTITFQNPAGAFSINQTTGEISVANQTLFDFETTPNMLATISIDNGIQTISKNAFFALNDVNEIGEYKFGGVIFWINAAGNEGYVVAMTDQSSGAPWGCFGFDIPLAEGPALGDGEVNTMNILSSCTDSGIAADLANDPINGFNDWFLPSVAELNEVYNNKATLNASIIANGGTAFSNLWYWTSTQQGGNANNAYFQSFSSGTITVNSKGNMAIVRAIRHWTDF